MAESKDARTRRLRQLRRKHLRTAARARRRRNAALRKAKRTKGETRDRARKDARNALRVYRRHREKAQDRMQDIRARRKSLRYRLKLKPKKGTAYFDGKPVAGWIAPILVEARRSGIWKGGVTSGLRTYMQQWIIFFVKRIRPAAYPGRSNHEGTEYPRGAVDVSDPAGLNRFLQAKGITKLKWMTTAGGLRARDPWHFSGTGR